MQDFRIVCPEVAVLICTLAYWLDMMEVEGDTENLSTSWLKRKYIHHVTTGMIQLTEEFEFPAKIVFAFNSMIINLRLRF